MFKTNEIQTIELGGIAISRMTYDETLQWIERRLMSAEFTQVATANMDFLSLCGQKPQLKEILNHDCHLVTADGMPLVWLSRLAGRPLPERVTGSDLVTSVSRLAAKLKLRVFFLGGDDRATPEAARRLCEQIPNLEIAGIDCARFDENDSEKVAAIADGIRAARADILFVALGCPKQERFIARNRDRLGVRFAIGVGGSFDFIAGLRKRAPRWMQRAGLEWVCRMAQEPRRLLPRYARNFACLARLVMNVGVQNA